MPRWFLRVVGAALMILCLAGCGRSSSESYRYKLTLAVNTPDGVKRASGVVEVTFWAVSIPASGIMHKLNGEALYLDLGAGRRPLIALLTSQLHPKYGKDVRWSRDTGPDLSRLYPPPVPGVMDEVSRVARMRGPRKITANDLPDLVTFVDVNDPATVIEVDPNDLQTTLGAGVSWEEITLESTDEPITTEIVKRLPWLRDYFRKHLRLDGSNLISNHAPANVLGWDDIDQSDDLRKMK